MFPLFVDSGSPDFLLLQYIYQTSFTSHCIFRTHSDIPSVHALHFARRPTSSQIVSPAPRRSSHTDARHQTSCSLRLPPRAIHHTSSLPTSGADFLTQILLHACITHSITVNRALFYPLFILSAVASLLANRLQRRESFKSLLISSFVRALFTSWLDWKKKVNRKKEKREKERKREKKRKKKGAKGNKEEIFAQCRPVHIFCNISCCSELLLFAYSW